MYITLLNILSNEFAAEREMLFGYLVAESRKREQQGGSNNRIYIYKKERIIATRKEAVSFLYNNVVSAEQPVILTLSSTGETVI